MKKVNSTQHRRTEKAIIDALLKISEIVQKTESSRLSKKSTNPNKHSKKTIGDGDYNQLHVNVQQQQVPIPPPMRTLDTYVSGFNQQLLQRPSNCNQASFHKPKQYDYKEQERSYKRDHSDNSSTSSDHCRKKSLSQKSFQSNTNPQPEDNQEYENQLQTNSYQINSASTTILDNQSSHSAVPIEQERITSPLNSKTDFDLFVDQQLQKTLDKHLRHHSLPSTTTNHENISNQRNARLVTLTKSETGKLIDELDFTKHVCNLEHYEKQVRNK